MRPSSRSGKLAVFAIALLINGSVQAFGPNRDAPIHVASDRAELDDQKGIATYAGDVVITQGQASLKADKVVVYTNDQGLTKIVATGKPAHYEEQDSKDGSYTHAYAETITYTRADDTIELLKNARLEQDNNSFQGDVIKYHTVQRKVTASSDKDAGGRVEMTIHPKKEPGAQPKP